MEIAELTTLADYFVIATGSSNTQINAYPKRLPPAISVAQLPGSIYPTDTR